ncbi:5-dehydro-4-deoxy-D-glucuronate isomerase [Terrarubrum flagellatum]|uniref:5-dehydro-4-deoxy-D-glucuronate isomerase n=1 Tax=Terrirubrum flagellatum TaxID=2895980 RepID=UPI003144F2F8
MDIEIRHAIHPDHAESFNTEELRKHFLVTGLFTPGRIKAVYTHYDRMVVFGIAPATGALSFGQELADLVKSPFFLSRREIGIFNVGGAGSVIADGKGYELDKGDALYLPMGTKTLAFDNANASSPAKFYACSAPAHAAHPAKLFKASAMKGDQLGAVETSNKRVLTKYMHVDDLPTCQIVMGYTRLETGNVWNSIPPHTHDRRMEAYLYFDLPKDQVVVHLMGRPQATRHLIVRNDEVVLSPPWSIHCGCGTSNYGFIWAMAGDNQTFTDMDPAPVSSLL